MPSREELVEKLRRQDLIDKLKASDQVDWDDEATRGAEKKYEETKPSSFESFGAGALEGASRDWADEVGGAVSSAFSDEPYEDAKSRISSRLKRSEVDNPVSYGSGKFVGSMAGAPLATTPLGVAGYAGAEGITRSLGRADKLDSDAALDAAGTGAIDAATGGTIAKVGGKVANAVGDRGKRVYEYLRNKAGESATKALGGNQGMIQRAGDKTADIGKLMLDEKVVTPFASNKAMQQRSYDLGEKLEGEISPIYDKASRQGLTRKDLADMTEEKILSSNRDPGTVDKATQFAKHKDNINAAEREFYNPSDIRKYRQSFDRKIKDFDKRGESSAMDAAQDMRWALREKEMGLIEKESPELMKKNEDLFRKSHLNYLGRDMADKGAARSASNNNFGLTSYITGAGAAGAGGIMVAAGAPPELVPILGATGMLGRELTRRYGSQMVGTGLNRLAKIIASPKYERIFKAAMKRGGTAVATTHQMLMDRDPEYRQQIEATLQDQGENK